MAWIDLAEEIAEEFHLANAAANDVASVFRAGLSIVSRGGESSRAALKARGLCGCGMPLAVRHGKRLSRCFPCLRDHANAEAAHWQDMAARGLCRCGGPRARHPDGREMFSCEVCAARARATGKEGLKKRRAALLSRGLCACSRALAKRGDKVASRCEACLAACARRATKRRKKRAAVGACACGSPLSRKRGGGLASMCAECIADAVTRSQRRREVLAEQGRCLCTRPLAITGGVPASSCEVCLSRVKVSGKQRRIDLAAVGLCVCLAALAVRKGRRMSRCDACLDRNRANMQRVRAANDNGR